MRKCNCDRDGNNQCCQGVTVSTVVIFNIKLYYSPYNTMYRHWQYYAGNAAQCSTSIVLPSTAKKNLRDHMIFHSFRPFQTVISGLGWPSNSRIGQSPDWDVTCTSSREISDNSVTQTHEAPLPSRESTLTLPPHASVCPNVLYIQVNYCPCSWAPPLDMTRNRRFYFYILLLPHML